MHGPEVLIPIILFVSIAVVFIVTRKFMNDERLALIEKGAQADIFNQKDTNTYPALRYGLLLAGAGLGLFVGNIVAELDIVDEDAAQFSFLLMFGGVGLIVSYFMERKAAIKDKKLEDDK